MRIPAVLLVLAGIAAAGGPARPDPDRLKTRLKAADREGREQAFRDAKAWARTDPAGVAALWDGTDTGGRCILVRALASCGTTHGVRIALEKGVTAEHEVFRALLDGLLAGGDKAMSAAIPDATPPARRHTLEALHLRWRVEEEMARLKSPFGQTGHYAGQYERIRKLGSGVVPVLIDMFLDRAHPLPGEGAAGPYQSIHPWMVRYEEGELRSLAGYAFSEVVDPADRGTLERLVEIFEEYWQKDRDTVENDLAATLAYSLHDLGVKWPVGEHLGVLHRQARRKWGGFPTQRALQAWWELGFAYIRIGEFEKGEHWYEELLKQRESSKAIASYNLACNFSMRAQTEPRRREYYVQRALHYLSRAIHQYQYTDWGWMEEDKDLSFIRNHPEYKKLRDHLKRKYPARVKGRIPKELEDFLKGSIHDPDEDDDK